MGLGYLVWFLSELIAVSLPPAEAFLDPLKTQDLFIKQYKLNDVRVS